MLKTSNIPNIVFSWTDTDDVVIPYKVDFCLQFWSIYELDHVHIDLDFRTDH